MDADRVFAKMAQEKIVAEAFGADALRFSSGAPERVPGAIKAPVAKAFADGGALNWEPKEDSASADRSQAVVWRKQTDGSCDPKTKTRSLVRVLTPPLIVSTLQD